MREAERRRAARGQGLPVRRRLHVDRAGNSRIAPSKSVISPDTGGGRVGRDGGPGVGELGDRRAARMHRAILSSFASVCAEGCVVEPGPRGPPPGRSFWHFACAALNAGDAGSIRRPAEEAARRARVREVGHAVGAHALGERERPRAAGGAGSTPRWSRAPRRDCRWSCWGSSCPASRRPGPQSRVLRRRAGALVVSGSAAVDRCCLASGLLLVSFGCAHRFYATGGFRPVSLARRPARVRPAGSAKPR